MIQKNLHRRTFLHAATAASVTLGVPMAWVPRTAQAREAFPSRPIRLIVPFPAGGGTDVLARLVANSMSEHLGTPFLVDNRSGGGTVIGSDFVAKSPPDGHTVLLTTSALAINASLMKRLPYDTQSGFTEVGMLARGPNMLVTRADSPYKTIQSVIEAARAKPGKLTFGSSGNGSSVHLAGELFKYMAKVNLTHVPYRGAAPAYTDLLGGTIDFVFASPGSVGPFIEAGQMRVLGITSSKRAAAYKDVPTIAETVSGYAAEVWYALFAPGGTPPAVVSKLNAALRRAAAIPTFAERLSKEGLDASVNSPEDMTKFMREEVAHWKRIIVAAKISMD